jgi:hypothetical protein
MLYEIERKLRGRFEIPVLRPEFGVLLASYPKSGNTWLKFLIANYFNELNCWYQEINFHNIHYIVPEIRGNRKLKGIVVKKKSPLFLKTHFPHTKYFNNYRNILLLRDPADTLRSYYIYLTQEKSINFSNGVDGFLSHWRYGIDGWVKFHKYWQGNSDCVIHYEDLIQNTYQAVKKVLEFHGVDVIDEALIQAVEKSKSDNMKKVLHKEGDPRARNKQFEFVGKGKSGQSKDFFTKNQLIKIQNKTKEISNGFEY